MTNYEKLVKALRCKRDDCEGCDLAFLDNDEGWICQYAAKDDDSADAIEALQAEVERLKDSNDELREAQTYIDHYGDTWQTSAKDVPTAAYQHPSFDGRDEAIAKMKEQLPKRGEWILTTETSDDGAVSQHINCSVCGFYWREPKHRKVFKRCPNCGADMRKMEVQDADS
jgi:FtsZ-binding cell division protein ZapB